MVRAVWYRAADRATAGGLQLDEDEGWYEPRGNGPNTLAELEEPLEHEWTDADGDYHYVNSAMVLMICFISLEDAPFVVAYARFWAEFLEFVDTKLEAVEVDGEDVNIHVDATDLDSLEGADEELAQRAMAPIEAASSRTIEEIRSVADLLLHAAPYSIESGWRVLMDS